MNPCVSSISSLQVAFTLQNEEVIVTAVKEFSISHSLPPGTWCTTVGCYGDIWPQYAIQTTSCLIGNFQNCLKYCAGLVNVSLE